MPADPQSPLTLSIDPASLAPLIHAVVREALAQLHGERRSPEAAGPRADDAERLLLDTREAAKVLGISPRQVARLAESGELPHVRIGRLVRFPLDALRAWVAKQAEQPGI